MSLYSRNRPSVAWIVLPVLAVVAVVSAIIVATVSWYYSGNSPSPYYYGPPYYFGGFGWPFFGFGWIFIPIVFLLLFFGLRWFFWRGWGRGYYDRHSYYDPALETLRERYARGEITKEQFEQLTKELQDTR